MVINREFFFRGWLPAGLLINARMSTSPSPEGQLPLCPLINPSPESSWPSDQPPIVFPVTQATESKAILLKDALSDGAIAMLPLGAWYGSGSPYILATNTWYEGRIQEISGEDVMLVNIIPNFTLHYYSYYSGLDHEDVLLTAMPIKWIPGVKRDIRAFKDANSVMSEVGYMPTVKAGDADVSLPLLDIKRIETIDLAGMRMAYSAQSPAGETRIIQCSVAGKELPPDGPIKYMGLIASANANVQNFYSVTGDRVAAKLSGPGLIKSQTIGVLSTGAYDDQVIHYN